MRIELHDEDFWIVEHEEGKPTTLEEMTENVDPCAESTVILAEDLEAIARRKRAVLLTANQCGRTERVAYIRMKGAGKVCNLDADPCLDENEEKLKPLFEKPVKIYNSNAQKILVPIFTKLAIEYEKVGTGERVTTACADQNKNLIWYSAAMILNGVVNWCAKDYGTFKHTAETRKPKPNAPCVCGSNRKFKQCCGR